MSFRAMKFGSLRQVRKPEAFKRFQALQPIMVCASNMRPIGMIYQGAWIGRNSILQWVENADSYGPSGYASGSSLWKGDVFTTAWEMMLNNFCAYMSPEEGRYPCFYVDESDSSNIGE